MILVASQDQEKEKQAAEIRKEAQGQAQLNSKISEEMPSTEKLDQ